MSRALDWTQLLCSHCLSLDAEGQVITKARSQAETRSAAEADVQRVLFSAPFRRLAGKTQVHPFARVDSVHNRLTHSLEVSETGAGLAEAVGLRLGLTDAQRHAAKCHVRAACLGHDIGNPPYGHAGEYAIQHWARRHESDLKALLAQDEEPQFDMLRDWICFDGNAQTFRLLAHPQPRDSAYFRLTLASLGAIIKYPWGSDVGQTKNNKFSCFQSAKPWMDLTFQELGLPPSTRHPLSYLMELADDICYCVTDCEDAVNLKLLEANKVRDWLVEVFAPETKASIPADISIPHLRAKVIGDLIAHFTDEVSEAFLHPEALPSFEAASPTWARLKQLKKDYSVVFDNDEKIQHELQAQKELGQTLDAFLETLSLIRSSHLPYSEALFVKYTFGEPFVAQHRHQPYSWWLHAMFDFVIGMTDAYLRRFAKVL